MPDTDEYLVKCFGLIGVTSDLGVSPDGVIVQSAITWNEINNFVKTSGYNLTGWEAEQLILMSRAYLVMSYKAKDITCVAPYSEINEDSLRVARERANKQFDSW